MLLNLKLLQYQSKKVITSDISGSIYISDAFDMHLNTVWQVITSRECKVKGGSGLTQTQQVYSRLHAFLGTGSAVCLLGQKTRKETETWVQRLLQPHY